MIALATKEQEYTTTGEKESKKGVFREGAARSSKRAREVRAEYGRVVVESARHNTRNERRRHTTRRSGQQPKKVWSGKRLALMCVCVCVFWAPVFRRGCWGGVFGWNKLDDNAGVLVFESLGSKYGQARARGAGARGRRKVFRRCQRRRGEMTTQERKRGTRRGAARGV